MPVLIALCVVVAYHNTLHVPLVFDDDASIVDNPTIRALWPPLGPLSPPARNGLTVEGRPVLNASLAFNYAISRTAVWSYHALNLLLHIANAALVYGVVRRTLLRASLRERFGARSAEIAFVAALLWGLHPLQTSAVTYTIQRAESLCALFYLLVLYTFIRGVEAGSSRLWLVASQVSCLLGMASKEVMVTSPLIVLLYDRTFVAGGLRESWSARRSYYLGLFASWALLAWLVVGAHGRGGTAGFAVGDAIPYALTQFRAIVLYLQLAFWPYPQVFDYGDSVITDPMAVLPQAVLVVAMALATLYALRRHPALGFLGAWFFLILSPSSSIVPVATQTIAEHRMYLPLAAVVVLAVVGLYVGLGRRARPVALAAALALGILTVRRNAVYETPVSLWRATVEAAPQNPRAHNALGLELSEGGQGAEALEQISEALRLEPQTVEYGNNFAVALADQGLESEALEVIEGVSKSAPGFAPVWDTKARILAQMGRRDEAVTFYERALELDPISADVHNRFGQLLLELGRMDEAAAHLAEAVRLRPDWPEAEEDLRAVRQRIDARER